MPPPDPMRPFRRFGRDSRGIDAWRGEVGGRRLLILQHVTSGIQLWGADDGWDPTDLLSTGFRSLDAAATYARRRFGGEND